MTALLPTVLLTLSEWSIDHPKHLPATGEVHLWRINLDHNLDAVLSDDEQQRADSMRIPEIKTRFCNGRTALRHILASYLGLPAGMLIFQYGEHGRPSLLAASNRLDFNLSHSGASALLGISSGAKIGVDIEQLRPRKNLLAIAQKKFSRQQLKQLQQVEGDERQRLFFQFWTVMEAKLKARGGSVFDRPACAITSGMSRCFLLPSGYIAALHLRNSGLDSLLTFQFFSAVTREP